MLNTFEFMNDWSLGMSQLSFPLSELTKKELEELMNFGFALLIYGGRVEFEKNKEAFSKLILEDLCLDDHMADLIEARFDSKEDALEEIRNNYLKDYLTLSEVKEDIQTDTELLINTYPNNLKAKRYAKYVYDEYLN